MSLTTPQNERVRNHRGTVILHARQLTALYECGPEAFHHNPAAYDTAIQNEEDRLDDAIVAYMSARNR